eukprot:4361404-Alexandrium_andersonii.AAC.1
MGLLGPLGPLGPLGSAGVCGVCWGLRLSIPVLDASRCPSDAVRLALEVLTRCDFKRVFTAQGCQC